MSDKGHEEQRLQIPLEETVPKADGMVGDQSHPETAKQNLRCKLHCEVNISNFLTFGQSFVYSFL